MSDGKSKCAQHAQLACAVFTHNFGDAGFGVPLLTLKIKLMLMNVIDVSNLPVATKA